MAYALACASDANGAGIGAPPSGKVAVVCVTGASAFVRKTTALVADGLADRGIASDMVDSGRYAAAGNQAPRAIVLVSPVYGSPLKAMIRQFVTDHAPFASPLYVVLTGWFPGLFDAHDLPTLTEFLDSKGVPLAAAVKIGTADGRALSRKKIAAVADAIAGGR
jgi:hypothetical protein